MALSSALVALSLVALFFLVHQSKQFYEEHQKFLRLESYKRYMEEVAASMSRAEKEAGLGIAQLEGLNLALQMSMYNTSSTRAYR